MLTLDRLRRVDASRKICTGVWVIRVLFRLSLVTSLFSAVQCRLRIDPMRTHTKTALQIYRPDPFWSDRVKIWA